MEGRWYCGSDSRWLRSPRSQSPPPTGTPSVPPARPAGRESRPAGRSESHGASEAASGRYPPILARGPTGWCLSGLNDHVLGQS